MNWQKVGLCGLGVMLYGGAAAWAGDGIVALQTAAPSCADPTSTDRYIDCGNGTVTDNETGLVWLKDANCLGGKVDWFTAMEFVAGLSDKPATSAAASQDCGLSDGSSPGEWRLPSIEEWEAMVAGAAALGCAINITNDAGDGCWVPGCETAGACSFFGVEFSGEGANFDCYWSATSFLADMTRAFDMCIEFVDGVDDWAKEDPDWVWPVRGGQ